MKYARFTEIAGVEELADDASILGDDILGDEHDVASRDTRPDVNGMRSLYL